MRTKCGARALSPGLGNSNEGALREKVARRLHLHKSVGAAQIGRRTVHSKESKHPEQKDQREKGQGTLRNSKQTL